MYCVRLRAVVLKWCNSVFNVWNETFYVIFDFFVILLIFLSLVVCLPKILKIIKKKIRGFECTFRYPKTWKMSFWTFPQNLVSQIQFLKFQNIVLYIVDHLLFRSWISDSKKNTQTWNSKFWMKNFQSFIRNRDSINEKEPPVFSTQKLLWAWVKH